MFICVFFYELIFRPRPKKGCGPIGLGCPSVCLSVILFYTGLNFGTEILGLNERFGCVDVPFDHFGQKHPRPEVVKLAKNNGFHRKYI